MTDLTNIFPTAIGIAVAAHKNQVDKGGHPYIGHPARVAGRVSFPTINDDTIVAFLHDVVEDTPVTLGDLREIFPDHIVDAIDAITRRKNEKETFFDYINRCAENPIARRVKIMDIVDNSDISRVEHDEEMVKEIKGMIKSRYVKALKILGTDYETFGIQVDTK